MHKLCNTGIMPRYSVATPSSRINCFINCKVPCACRFFASSTKNQNLINLMLSNEAEISSYFATDTEQYLKGKILTLRKRFPKN